MLKATRVSKNVFRILLVWGLSWSLASLAFAQVYVSLSGDNTTGDSWTTAYQTIQAGIDDADVLDEEVWVAQGTYDEQRVSVMHDPPVDTGSVVMKEGVHVYGGFAGTENARDQRDWSAHVTTIDGFTARGGNAAFHVVVGADNATIDGFTITGGYAHGPVPNAHECYGAGMFNDGCSPTVSNCTFLNNSASYGGGGMGNFDSASPTITNCTFSGNDADWGGGMNGSLSTSIITNCLFSGNSASSDGGGIYNSSCSLTVTNCVFSNNSVEFSGGRGGAMFNAICSSTITNCIFSNNSCQDGGGMYNLDSPLVITNCTFFGNTLGGGIHNSGGSPTVTNCILWNDSPGEIYNELGSSPTVTYSDVEGGYSGEGNIDLDPQFVNPPGGDLHVQPGSPCVDAGCSIGGLTQDFEGDPRPYGPGFDIGADEYFDADADSDGDGISNGDEGAGDPDEDGTSNYLDLDSDGDGIPDAEEGSEDRDGDTVPNFLDTDSDGDGISDAYEGTYDPDDDGIPNYLDGDSDGDYFSDAFERIVGTDPYDANDVPAVPLAAWPVALVLFGFGVAATRVFRPKK
jgi:parallel beta-helix repeat protein/predicted outer membrane repeat protein